MARRIHCAPDQSWSPSPVSNRAVEYGERAKKLLYAFPASAERDALLALPDYVLSRDR